MKERIKMLRKALDMTQQEFADKIGLKRNSVASYEIGKNYPMDTVIKSICREFNVNEEWLRTGEGEMFIEVDEDIALMQWIGSVLGNKDMTFQKRFVNMLSKLDEKDWESLEKISLLLIEDK